MDGDLFRVRRRERDIGELNQPRVAFRRCHEGTIQRIGTRQQTNPWSLDSENQQDEQ